MRHVARKRFGQHFLTDGGIIEGIVEGISPSVDDHMVEIGPGLGALTLPLLRQLKHLTVVELDRDLVTRLQANPQLTVIDQDVLRVDFLGIAQTAPDRPLRVVGNLPYNISTPILFHLLGFVDVIKDQHFMLQKEVVDRMVAAPRSAAYGRLSVMLQWRYEMVNFLHVPPQSFDPPPRVDSAMVRMVPKAQPPVVDVGAFSEMVQIAFSQRRKLLRHTLGAWLEAKGYTGPFNVRRRAEEVTVDEYVALHQAVHGSR
ncbi:16S rRNA (adenine(1518)-N(6)/adenine(1519)-N(6))-dimethyltransferase RsmA [Burkholderiaceae bacterium]|nr:16S rRNA (adenine(1518)-N(6)/adenine(1519)-N(6))-dimethyltransferase RsmA [Burkholderiaceae bacterium]